MKKSRNKPVKRITEREEGRKVKNGRRKDPKTRVQTFHYKITILVSYTISPATTEFSLDTLVVDRDSSVGIGACYVLDVPGTESWCGRDFPHLS